MAKTSLISSYRSVPQFLKSHSSGSIIIIELKRERTSREIVAQAIDYASWVKDLDASDIAEIFDSHRQKLGRSDVSLDQAFHQEYGKRLEEDDLNSSHQMVIVATELDSSTERIVRYLSEYNVAINAVFFRVFQDGDSMYLSRAWFIDPSETLEQATTPRGNEPWNGEFYVSFGHGDNRLWEEAAEYGFICGGGGRWYSNTLNKLSTGDRVWVNVPRTGYVGVGEVTSPAVMAKDYMIRTEDGEVSFYEAGLKGNYHQEFINDEDKAEYIVGVKWLKKVPLGEAESEVGFFGNQNTVAQPTVPKWPHTVARLKVLFGVE